jgi:glycosyltransferase involved in cell wall biosynthesis
MAGAKHGGAETAFVDMCLALHETGEDIAVATRANDLRVGQLRDAGIAVYELPFGGAIDIYTPWRLKKIIRDFAPQIVQTWMSRAAQKTPNWRDNRAAAPYLTVARLGNYYGMKYFRSCDYFTTITPMIRDYLIEQGVAPDDVRHINNFAETENVYIPVDRAALDTPAAAPLLLSLGRLHRAKAFDTLLRAVAQAPGVYLWIAGEGPDRAPLESLRTELGLEGRVRFLGWRDDRAALLQTADICVFPSRFEPFGTVFVQAWAQKTPLITTAADGPRQFVRDGEDGLMVPVDDVVALRDAIVRLAGDPALRARLAAAGHARYEAEFTRGQSVRAYLSFYLEILERRQMAAAAG